MLCFSLCYIVCSHTAQRRLEVGADALIREFNAKLPAPIHPGHPDASAAADDAKDAMRRLQRTSIRDGLRSSGVPEHLRAEHPEQQEEPEHPESPVDWIAQQPWMWEQQRRNREKAVEQMKDYAREEIAPTPTPAAQKTPTPAPATVAAAPTEVAPITTTPAALFIQGGWVGGLRVHRPTDTRFSSGKFRQILTNL